MQICVLPQLRGRYAEDGGAGMSVVVRMEMPGCCWDCPCLDDCGDYPRCRISNEQRGYNFPIHEKRMPRCPITQPLPEGHGRLVDADTLFDSIIKFYGKYGPNLGLMDMRVIFNNSPTIVPAERSET